MRAVVFSNHEFDREALTRANARQGHEFTHLQPRLEPSTPKVAQGCPAVVAFANDDLDAETLETLCSQGVRLVPLTEKASVAGAKR